MFRVWVTCLVQERCQLDIIKILICSDLKFDFGEELEDSNMDLDSSFSDSERLGLLVHFRFGGHEDVPGLGRLPGAGEMST